MTETNDQDSLIIVAILTIHAGAVERFREYEAKAARILSRYGGALDRTVEVEPSRPDQRLREVHLLRFPNRDAFARYQADPDLAALASSRRACIAETEVLIGRDGPNYASLAE